MALSPQASANYYDQMTVRVYNSTGKNCFLYHIKTNYSTYKKHNLEFIRPDERKESVFKRKKTSGEPKISDFYVELTYFCGHEFITLKSTNTQSKKGYSLKSKVVKKDPYIYADTEDYQGAGNSNK